MASTFNNGETGLAIRTKLNTNANELNTAETDIVGKQAADADLTAIAALTPANDDIIQRKTGAWTNRTVAQYKTDLALNNVDNTSDTNKPVSTAQAAADALKQDKDAVSTTFDDIRTSATNITLATTDRNVIIIVTNVGATAANIPLGLGAGASGFPIQASAYVFNHTSSTNNVTITPAGGVTFIGDVTIRPGQTAKITRTATNTYFRQVDIPGGGSMTALKTALSLSSSDVGLANVDDTSDANKPVSSAQQTALDLKQNHLWTSLSGTAIRFDKNTVYGTTGAPETGNITFVNTAANIGVQVVMFHNNASPPSFGAEFHEMTSVSAGYTNATLNIIRFQYFDVSNIWYDIQKL